MTTASEEIKRIDVTLAAWSRWVKSGYSIGHLGYPKSSAFVTPTSKTNVDDNLMEYIDNIIGAMPEPYRRVIRRKYLDKRSDKSVKAGRSTYYPDTRTQFEMARVERMTTHNFADVLRMARHRLLGALQDIL